MSTRRLLEQHTSWGLTSAKTEVTPVRLLSSDEEPNGRLFTPVSRRSEDSSRTTQILHDTS